MKPSNLIVVCLALSLLVTVLFAGDAEARRCLWEHMYELK
jgi:hypothetical protein